MIIFVYVFFMLMCVIFSFYFVIFVLGVNDFFVVFLLFHMIYSSINFFMFLSICESVFSVFPFVYFFFEQLSYLIGLLVWVYNGCFGYFGISILVFFKLGIGPFFYVLFFFFVNESEYKNFKIYFKNILFFIIICFIFLCLILILYNIISFFLVFFYNIFDFLFSDFDCHCQSDGEEDGKSSSDEELTAEDKYVIESYEESMSSVTSEIESLSEESVKDMSDLENLLKLEKEFLANNNLPMADGCSSRMNVLEVFIGNHNYFISFKGQNKSDWEKFFKEYMSNSSNSSSS